jgi:adenine-specific DNA-methyltransferase
LHDRRVNGGNVLTGKTLEIIQHDLSGLDYDKLVIYGEYSRIGSIRLKAENIEFKQTPYDVKKK